MCLCSGVSGVSNVWCTKDLLTSFARSVRQSICLRFSYRQSNEGARSVQKKTEGKYFPLQTEQTRLIRHYMAFGSFSSLFISLCSSSDVVVYLWVSSSRFVFALVRHSFASLTDKHLSRKATLMFQDVLLFELFQRTLPNPFLFSFKST